MGCWQFFVDDWCAGNGKMCCGAGVCDSHVDRDFYFRSVHKGIGAEVHSLCHFCPCFLSGWERLIVLSNCENIAVLLAVAVDYSCVIVVRELGCTLCGGRISSHIETNFVVTITITIRP